jgi:hypothetical protein
VHVVGWRRRHDHVHAEAEGEEARRRLVVIVARDLPEGSVSVRRTPFGWVDRVGGSLSFAAVTRLRPTARYPAHTNRGSADHRTTSDRVSSSGGRPRTSVRVAPFGL